MNLGNFKTSLQGKYFSILEYVNNSFDVFRIFVTRHPVLVFFHFLFSVALELFISFALWEPLRKFYEMALKYVNTQNNVNMKEYALAALTVLIYLMGCLIISGILEFVGAIIRKKIGLEIEDKIREFKLLEVIVKFIVILFANMLIGVAIIIIAVTFSIFANPLVMIATILLILKLNLLYFKQAYYLRDINIIEAFKYNFHLSRGKRLVIIIPLIIIAFVTFLINQFCGWIFEIIIKNPQMLIIVVSIIIGLIKTISEIFTITIENVIYLNLEYMDLKELKKVENGSE